MEKKDGEKDLVSDVEGFINESRVISFSDSVFAFAATLLVLKIDLPDIDQAQIATQLPQELLLLWPTYLANIISFLLIGYYWLNHHALFSLLRKMNSTIVWLNIVFLIFLSFLPFPVDLFGDYADNPTVILFYSLSLALVGGILLVIWTYACEMKFTQENLTSRHLRYYTLRLAVAPVVFALSAPVAFIDPFLAKISWIFLIIGILLINHFFKYKRESEMEKLTV